MLLWRDIFKTTLLLLIIINSIGLTMPKVTVQPGSNLFQIARGTGYTPEQLAAYNMLEDPNQIRVGQDIFIPYSQQEFESFAGPMTQPVQATTPVQSTATQPVVQTRQAEPVSGFTWGKASKERLGAVNPIMAKVANRALELSPYDFTIAQGLRTIEEQKKLVAEGKSQTMRSKHLGGTAIDFAPIVNGKANWDEKYVFAVADAFKKAADELGVNLRWGGNWNKNLSDYSKSTKELHQEYLDDRKKKNKKPFIDLVHFEMAFK